MKTKPARELRPGDKVNTDNGVDTVVKTVPGFIRYTDGQRSVMVILKSGEFGQLPVDAEIILA